MKKQFVKVKREEPKGAFDECIQTPRPTNETKVLTQKQALELLRLRGYVIMDDPLDPEPLPA